MTNYTKIDQLQTELTNLLILSRKGDDHKDQISKTENDLDQSYSDLEDQKWLNRSIYAS